MNGPLYSVFASKCPKCNLDDLYIDNNPYHVSKLAEMKKGCDYCGQKYEPETGFYYGAMYVSYGVSVTLMFIPAAIIYFGFNAGFWAMFSLILAIYAFGFPLIFRWSRNIWLNIFVKFDKNLHKELAAKQTMHHSKTA